MKAKSLSVFRTKLRKDDPAAVLVNIGDTIEGDDEHLRSLARNGLVELIESNKAAKQPDAKNEDKTKKIKGATKSDKAAKQPDAKDEAAADGSAVATEEQ